MDELTEVMKNMSDEEFSNFSCSFYDESHKRCQRRQERILEHKREYIGKCYKSSREDGGTTYFMVVDINTCTDSSLICFYFITPIRYQAWLDPDGYYGMDVDSFCMLDTDNDTINIKSDYTEIDGSEFFAIFDKYIPDLRQKLQDGSLLKDSEI